MPDIITKICSACGVEKEVKDFHRSRNSKDGYRTKCRVCVNKKRRERIEKNKAGDYAKYIKLGIGLSDELVGPERQKAYHEQYRKVNKKQISENKKKELDRAKLEGIIHYGSKCTCCGESTIEFLTLEHLNGRVKGKKRRSGKGAWLEARRLKYPATMTVLCFNCNCAKGVYGSCPHTWKNNEKDNNN